MLRGRPLGLLGFGHFARAVATLAERAGLTVLAFDPHVEVPGGVRAASRDELAERADVIVLAVPLAALRSGLADLGPRLTARHRVIDVCSVKEEPASICAELLGARVPYALTHPLFGPMTVSDPGRTHDVIVCPAPAPASADASATEVASALFAALGCRIVSMTTGEHDALMARTQALAFFVGRGLSASGLLDAPAHPVTPSAELIVRLMQQVSAQSDAVREAIMFHNTHASSARVGLLAALRQVASLGPQSTDTLTDLRAEIDELDVAMLDLLTRRASLARRVSRVKAAAGDPVRDTARETSAFADRRQWAKARGLDPEFVEGLFQRVLLWSRALQEDERAARAVDRLT